MVGIHFVVVKKVGSSWPPWPSSVHILIFNYPIIPFWREFALHGVDLLPLAHALALGTMSCPKTRPSALFRTRIHVRPKELMSWMCAYLDTKNTVPYSYEVQEGEEINIDKSLYTDDSTGCQGSDEGAQ
jgi:hypothetical protein